MNRQQRGFSLIELIIVVVIMGLLAATALPRFLTATDEAEDATVDGVAGGFATAVGLVRAQWELEDRPIGDNNITLDGIELDVGSSGFPTSLGTANATENTMNVGHCLDVWNNILQSPPRATTSTAEATVLENRYFVDVTPGSPDICTYYLVATIEAASAATLNGATSGAVAGNGFTYNPLTGRVDIFSNN